MQSPGNVARTGFLVGWGCISLVEAHCTASKTVGHWMEFMSTPTHHTFRKSKLNTKQDQHLHLHKNFTKLQALVQVHTAR
jgi:hypothetical protein